MKTRTIFVSWDSPEGADIESGPLKENLLVVPAPESHVSAKRRSIPFAELAHAAFVMREEKSGKRMTIEREYAERGQPCGSIWNWAAAKPSIKP